MSPPTRTRDQSYFLFATTPAQLARLRFPLGDIAAKAETRALGERNSALLTARQAGQPGHLLRAKTAATRTWCAEAPPGGDAVPGEIVDLSGPRARPP
jgi:tRNA-specific 2-thiouridylase